MSLVTDRRRSRRSLAGRRVAFLLTTDAAVSRAGDLRPLLDSEPRIWRRDRQSTGALRRQLAAPPGVDLIVREAGTAASAAGGGNAEAELLETAASNSVEVVDFVALYSACTGRLPLTLLRASGVEHRLRTACAAPARRRRRWQRPIDFVFGAIFLLLAAPLLLAVAAAVAAGDGWPVLFRQRRLGRGERPFTLFKFRTMKRDAEAAGPRWATPGDPRVTRLGRYLRRHHLDELPQLWNLLRGDLTLIGPRPIRQAFARRLAERQPLYELRFLHPPGVTGWSQILGPYGSTEGEHLVKLEMDLLYISRGGLLDDLYILMWTARAAISGKGV